MLWYRHECPLVDTTCSRMLLSLCNAGHCLKRKGLLHLQECYEKKENDVALCTICGTNHDPDIPCGDGAGQIMRGVGIRKSRKMSKRVW